MAKVQQAYNTYPQRGYPGDLARPHEPNAIDLLPVQVPSSGRNPRPGDPVYWDATNDGAAVPTDANLNETVMGIVAMYSDQVASRLSAVPAGANSDAYIEYEDGDVMPVIVMGTVWLLAGAALEYGNLIRWNTSNFDWETVTKPTDFNTIIKKPIICVDVSVADTELFQARIGFGELF